MKSSLEYSKMQLKKFQARQVEKQRTLFVRLPHVIRKEQDVAKLFTGEFKVQLCRQSTRHCYVVFPTVEERLKNLEAVKDKKVNGKSVIVEPAIIKTEKIQPKLLKKKIVIPEVKEETIVTKTLFVSNIKPGTKLQDLKAAIPGSVSGKLLSATSKKTRCAMIKMESAQVAAEYLRKLRPRPIIGGKKLRFNPDTRKREKKIKRGPLKIYDGETEITDVFSNIKSNNNALDHIVLENKV